MDNRDSQISEIKSQISDIKSVMNISSSTFKMIYASDNFRGMFILAGIFSLFLPFIYHILLMVYENHSQIPGYLLIGFYAAIFVCWLVLIIVRTKVTIRKAAEMDIKENIFKIVMRILKTRMWIAVVPAIIFMTAIQLKYFPMLNRLEVAYYGVVLGIVLNMIGVMINEKEYIFTGFWAMLSGAFLLFVFPVPVHIAFALILAPADFIFVIVNSIKRKESVDEIG